MAKLITNPLETAVEIGVKGTQYVVEAKGSLKVSDEVAQVWKTTHAFLTVTDDSSSAEEVASQVEEVLSEGAENVEDSSSTSEDTPEDTSEDGEE